MRTEAVTLLEGDCRELLREQPAGIANCCVTSPPYWRLRDYGEESQLGLEQTPTLYVEALVKCFAEVRRVLTKDATLWVVLSDTYVSQGGVGQGNSGLLADRRTLIDRRITPTDSIEGRRRKNMLGIPWRFALAMQDDGWNLRQDVIWSKPNALPESVKDRCTRQHEYVFMFSRSHRYHYDHFAIQERSVDGGMRNARSVWEIPTVPGRFDHPASFPVQLASRCIAAGCAAGGLVLDPFSGTGTTGAAALMSGRMYLGLEISPSYHAYAVERLSGVLFQ